ncbi:hypothetical protein I350_04289 [Cryptococcus amylolentus CBS 6273]|uniref:Uncharacterized protein n=1 Tax=Cryptococcus amylolentus CBS 6273 TaxID=1296118 RepID=A0A1E3K189_9TREE|nr:hypothetical protein I350_04289 [Cryptococcus amylolentus CBS 6273]
MKGWITPTLSSAASQPSSSSLTEAPADKNVKRVATSSVEAHGFTAKELRVRGDQTNIVGPFASSMKHKLTRLHQNPPTPETAPRHHIASTQDEPDPDSDSDDISSDEDDNGDDADSDDGQSGELDDGFARCMRAEEMPSTNLPVTGDDFWMKYLVRPLENHAYRLGLKPTPLLDATHKRLSEVLDFVLGSKRVNYFWTVNPMSRGIWERLLGLLGLYMPTNFQELLAGPEPPSTTQIYSHIEANGVCCNEDEDRLDELEGRGEAQSRCIGAYWKVALPEDDVDFENTDDEEADEQEANEQDAEVHTPPPGTLIHGTNVDRETLRQDDGVPSTMERTCEGSVQS